MAPDDDGGGGAGESSEEGSSEAVRVMGFQLMYMAHEGLLDDGADPNFLDSDGRTAMHIAACEGHAEVVELLLQCGVDAVPEDQWGSTSTALTRSSRRRCVVLLLDSSATKSVARSPLLLCVCVVQIQLAS